MKKEKAPKKVAAEKAAPKGRPSRSKSLGATSKKEKAEKKSKAKPVVEKEERSGRARKTDKGKSAAAAQENNQDKMIFNAFLNKPDERPASPAKLGLGFQCQPLWTQLPWIPEVSQ